jgi:hypothetical protein
LELTDEEKQIAYQSIYFMENAVTDSGNAEVSMKDGRFFDSMGYIMETQNNVNDGIIHFKKFVKMLQDKKIWT